MTATTPTRSTILLAMQHTFNAVADDADALADEIREMQARLDALRWHAARLAGLADTFEATK